jgi:hypothetical protein
VLRDNDITPEFKRILINAKIPTDFVEIISILINLYRNGVAPEDAYETFKLIRNKGLRKDILQEWIDVMGITDKSILAMLKYEPVTTGQELMDAGFKGAGIGNEMRKREGERFKELLKESRIIKSFADYQKIYERNDEVDLIPILDTIYDIDRKGNEIHTYIHTTSKSICEDVLENGFEFWEFRKTVDEITNRIEDFAYKTTIRDQYGDCVLVIQTLEHIVDGEDVTIKEPFYSEEAEEMVYTLSPTHVRGYFNKDTGKFVENPKFKLS